MARQLKIGSRLLRGVIVGTVVVGLAACVAQFRNHGYVPSDEDLANVIVGVDTRASVEETVGIPTTGGVLNGAGFYYVSSRWKRVGGFAPQIIDRQLVAITFDDAGVVQNIERFTLADGQVVTLSRRVTDSNVRNTTFLRQLMGNLANFNPAAVLGDS
ncbi:outer membrane protein assembly factor BamE [Thalassobium sp. R2A62]|uniref:outer membrane protein assembly factor BamE n=1 Tax=Thalassobium sp. R2A62 TaxID=633131 RepID=UPI0001B1D583|nr:outer membrane protein assembly factor BamE [Thalassobium sp. R2A62]EET48575.1 lipoprotein, SmpA/OmlA family [Thalassobium sp. R2A62]MDG1340913.1 outer membrane protein assembly factor BamE [Paracoccaceae bacterium]MDG2453659.1 outer membrane protein assembly factor BamE [Paracoccaceae bacterium]